MYDVEDNCCHNDLLKLGVGYQVMEVLPPLLLWYVCGFVFWLLGNDKFLNVFPVDVFLSVTFQLFFLGFVELQKQDTDEEVQEEERANENEDDVEESVSDRCFF